MFQLYTCTVLSDAVGIFVCLALKYTQFLVFNIKVMLLHDTLPVGILLLPFHTGV